MPWIELFETSVNGLSIVDYCRRELRSRSWEGPGSGSENKCKNLFTQLIYVETYLCRYYLCRNLFI